MQFLDCIFSAKMHKQDILGEQLFVSKARGNFK